MNSIDNAVLRTDTISDFRFSRESGKPMPKMNS